MYIHGSINTPPSPFFVSIEDLKLATSQVSRPHLAPRSWFLIPFSHRRNQGLEKWLVPGHRHETYKTIREHLVEPEREKVLETEAQPRKHTHGSGLCQQGYKVRRKDPQWPELTQHEQQNKGIVDYNLEAKINVLEATLMQINDCS